MYDQAMGRIWRPGQTKPVYVYRLIGHRTIESSILQVTTNTINIVANNLYIYNYNVCIYILKHV